MKIRSDYVTNSSSSSYIICFARIADEGKAKAIIDKYNLNVFNVDGSIRKRIGVVNSVQIFVVQLYME